MLILYVCLKTEGIQSGLPGYMHQNSIPVTQVWNQSVDKKWHDCPKAYFKKSKMLFLNFFHFYIFR